MSLFLMFILASGLVVILVLSLVFSGFFSEKKSLPVEKTESYICNQCDDDSCICRKDDDNLQ